MNNIHSWIARTKRVVLSSGLALLHDWRKQRKATCGTDLIGSARKENDRSDVENQVVFSYEDGVSKETKSLRSKPDFTRDLYVIRMLAEKDCARVFEHSGSAARRNDVIATRARSLCQSAKIDEHTFSIIVKAAKKDQHISIVESINDWLSQSGSTLELRIVGESRRKVRRERDASYEATLETSIYLCLFDHLKTESDSDRPLYLNPACLDFRIMIVINAGIPNRIFDYPYHGCLACRERIA